MIDAVGTAPLRSRLSNEHDPVKLKEAASQFEALLIGQLLKSARQANASEDGSQADSSMLEIAQEQLAQTLAKQGGLGVARLVMQGLDRRP